MPVVFRHTRRRSRFHARLHAEKERRLAGQRRRQREGANPRHYLDADDGWQHDWRCVDEDTSSPPSSSATCDEHEDQPSEPPS